jgi:hypothetical protein
MLLSGCAVMAQPRLSVAPSPHAELKLEAYQGGGAFDSAFNLNTYEYRDLHMLVANHSGRDILALVAVWRYRDAAGRAKTMTVETDSFQTPDRAPVISAGARALLGPSGIIPEGMLGRPGIGNTIMPKTLSRLAGVQNVAAVIDLVVFSDGEMSGPDLQHTVSELTARYNAAQKIVAAWRSGGQSAVDALQTDLNTSTDLQELHWIRSYANSISAYPKAQLLVDFLAAKPRPIEIHKNQKGAILQ